MLIKRIKAIKFLIFLKYINFIIILSNFLSKKVIAALIKLMLLINYM